MARALDLPPGIAAALRDAPTTDYIYSSLSFLRERFGGPIPGRWFVAALNEIGIEARAVRQTLFRMTRAGILVADRVGREKIYAPAPATVAILDAGRARTSEAQDDRWDGRWTIVHLRLDNDERELRDRLRDVLLVHGFGRLRSGVYLHPRDKTSIMLDAVGALRGVERVAVFRGERYGAPSDETLTGQLWDLPALGARYRRFIRRYGSIAARPVAYWSSRQAFALRFAYMFELFRITWDDPSLPSRFLPSDWPGRDARAVAEVLRGRLRASALEFAASIAERVGLRAIDPVTDAASARAARPGRVRRTSRLKGIR